MISSFIISLIGSLLAYLCFNFNPSKLIMGDVGSIPLGALISIIAILLVCVLFFSVASCGKNNTEEITTTAETTTVTEETTAAAVTTEATEETTEQRIGYNG